MKAYAIPRPATAFALDRSGKDTASFHDPAHLTFVRTLPSAISGAYGCEACHIRTGSGQHNKKRTGKAQKPSDAWVLPLTPSEHRAQHDGNEMAFWESHGIDPFDLAERLYRVSGDTEAAVKIIKGARRG